MFSRRIGKIGYEVVCLLVYFSGLYRLVLFLKRRSPVILAYHSVNRGDCPYVYPDNIVTVSNFESQMAYLTSKKRIITLSELVQCIKSGSEFPANAVVITFDDGYYDFYSKAYPILKKHKISCTLFPITKLLDTGDEKWEDTLSYAINTSEAKSLSVHAGGQKRSYKLVSSAQRLDCIRNLNSIVSRMNKTEREKILSEVESQLNGPSKIAERVMLGWNEVRQLREEGLVSFGCHTHSHRSLTSISPQVADQEISRSKQEMEQFLGEPCTFFCYPIGKKNDFNQTIKAMLEAERFHAAVTTIPGSVSKASDLYELKRISALNDASYKFKCSLIGVTLQRT